MQGCFPKSQALGIDAGQKESHLNPPLLFRDDDGGWAREHTDVEEWALSKHTKGKLCLSADVCLSISR